MQRHNICGAHIIITRLMQRTFGIDIRFPLDVSKGEYKTINIRHQCQTMAASKCEHIITTPFFDYNRPNVNCPQKTAYLIDKN